MNSWATAMHLSEEIGYQVDDLVIDIGRQRVSRGDAQIPLSTLSFELLLALARAAPNHLTFNQLIDQVWPGLVVSPETVSQRVKVVREALGDDAQAPKYISAYAVAAIECLRACSRGWAMHRTCHFQSLSSSRRLHRPTHLTRRGRFHIALKRLCHGPAVDSSDRGDRLGTPYICPATLADPCGVAGRALIGAGHAAAWRTIAVLPLLDISPNGGNEYLGDGLAEELSSRLSRIPGCGSPPDLHVCFQGPSHRRSPDRAAVSRSAQCALKAAYAATATSCE